MNKRLIAVVQASIVLAVLGILYLFLRPYKYYFNRERNLTKNNIQCSREKLSLFISRKCPDGAIGIGDSCSCSYHPVQEKNTSCQLGFMRQFLPSNIY